MYKEPHNPLRVQFRYRAIWTALKLVVCIGAFLSPAMADATPTRQTALKPIVVNSDNGGSVYRYAWKVAQASEHGTQVQIRGKCRSACTLYLAMPPDQICILPGARFSFHRAYGSSREANRMATAYILRKYPKWVRDWIEANGGLSSRIINMNYSYAVQFVRPCERRPRPRLASASAVTQASHTMSDLPRPATAAMKVPVTGGPKTTSRSAFARRQEGSDAPGGRNDRR